MEKFFSFIFLIIILTLNLTSVNGQSTEPIDKNINNFLKEDYKIVEVLDGQIVLLKDKDMVICHTRVQHTNSGKSIEDYINHSYKMKSRALKSLYDSQIKKSMNSENFNRAELFELLDKIDEVNNKINKILINSIKKETVIYTSCYRP